MKVIKHKYFLLLLIILIGAVLRLTALTKAIPALSQDEIVTGYDSWCLSQNLHDHHGVFLPFIPESFGDWTSPFINYISLPFLKVFGLSEYATRLPIAILGIASILLFYFFIKNIFKNEQTALVGAFLFATAPFAISLSRWAVPPATVPFTLLLFLNTFFWAKNKPSYLNFILVGLTGVLVIYSYPTMKLFFPPIAAILFFLYFKSFKWKSILGAIIFVFLISPLYYLAIKYPEIYNLRFNNIALASSTEPFISGFLSRYLGYITPYFYFGKGDEFMLHHVPGFGSIQEVLAFFSYAGLAFVIANAFKKLNFIEHQFSVFLLLFIVIAPIPASITIHKYTLLRNIHTVLFMLVFAVIGIHFIMENLNNRTVKNSILATIIIVVSFSVLNFSYYYFRQYKYDAQDDYHYGLKQVFEYLKTNDSKFTKVEINTNPIGDQGILVPYIYYLFYNKIEPGSYDVNSMTTHIGKYYFMDLKNESIKDIVPIMELPFGKYGFSYKIYETEPGVFRVTK